MDGSLYIVSRRNMVTIFEKQGQLNDALRFLTQERVNYPQHASFLYQAQADILKKMDNKKAALVLLDEAIKSLPDDPELIYAEPKLTEYESPFIAQNREIVGFIDKFNAVLLYANQVSVYSPPDAAPAFVMIEQCKTIVTNIRKATKRIGVSLNLT